jgi:hypothetical protein
MIARIWHGAMLIIKADEFLQYIQDTGVADISAVKGKRGCVCSSPRK